ncbi:MAG TPA: hypothetical protein DCS19_06365 [Flavobacterium sp.]|nr:hypothetical protein [Flavobacterium sp.]
MYVKVIKVNLKNGSNPLKEYDLDPKTKDIVGLAIRKVPNLFSDHIRVRIKNETLLEDLPVELLYCEFVSVPPDKRFFTLIPKIEKINNYKLNIDYYTTNQAETTVNLILLMNENEHSHDSIKR